MRPPLTLVFVNGKPGSGKDTQAKKLLLSLGGRAKIISTGEIYRSARDNEGEYARFHDQIIPYKELVDSKQGLVPDEVMIPIVQAVILENSQEGKDFFIFTGFPRTEGQLEWADRMVEMFPGSTEIHIHFDVSDETARDRAKARRDEAINKGETPRAEDENFDERLVTYRQKTLPMILKLGRQRRLISISAEGKPEDIFVETVRSLRNKEAF